jgi:hypothetical protein
MAIRSGVDLDRVPDQINAGSTVARDDGQPV